MQFTSTKNNSRQRTEQTLIRANKKQIHANKNPVLHLQFTSTKPNSPQHKWSLTIIWNLRESKLYVFMIKMSDNRQCRSSGRIWKNLCPNFGRAIYSCGLAVR